MLEIKHLAAGYGRIDVLRDVSLADHPTLTQLSIGMSNDFAVAIEPLLISGIS